MEPSSNITSNQNPISKFMAIGVVFLIILVFTASFFSGFLLSQFLNFPANPLIPQKPTLPPVSNFPPPGSLGAQQETTKFLPGKHYYEDGIYIQTKDSSRISIVGSFSRTEQNDSKYHQSTRVTYINGDKSARLTDSGTNLSSAINSDKIVQSWVTTFDPSRVLKESSEIKLKINSSNFSIFTGPLENELTIRSLPGYTKIFSKGDGEIMIDGQRYEANVVYYRLYSQNQSELQFYTQNLGLTTDLIIFWDDSGGLTLLDASEVERPQEKYKTHKIAFFESSSKLVSHSFDLSVDRDSKTLPNNYVVTINSPINSSLNLKRIKSVNKAPNNSYSWYLSSVEGTIVNKNGQPISGSGLAEYIHD